MDSDNIKEIYEIVNSIPENNKNKKTLDEIKKLLESGKIIDALEKIKILTSGLEITNNSGKTKSEKKEPEKLYPPELTKPELEQVYMGLLLNNPKLIAKYHFIYEDCLFEDPELLNIYKSVIFTEGEAYAPEIAKRDFNFSKDTEKSFKLKLKLKKDVIKELIKDKYLIVINIQM